MTEDDPKIYVDDDWKKQAREEKQRLSDKETKEQPPPASSAPAGPLPEPDLTTLISSFLSQTLFALGLIEQQGQTPPQVNLDLAKFNIGMLEVVERKTQGNLTEQEKGLLDQALHQARMAFVDVASRQGPIG